MHPVGPSTTGGHLIPGMGSYRSPVSSSHPGVSMIEASGRSVGVSITWGVRFLPRDSVGVSITGRWPLQPRENLNCNPIRRALGHLDLQASVPLHPLSRKVESGEHSCLFDRYNDRCLRWPAEPLFSTRSISAYGHEVSAAHVDPEIGTRCHRLDCFFCHGGEFLPDRDCGPGVLTRFGGAAIRDIPVWGGFVSRHRSGDSSHLFIG